MESNPGPRFALVAGTFTATKSSRRRTSLTFDADRGGHFAHGVGHGECTGNGTQVGLASTVAGDDDDARTGHLVVALVHRLDGDAVAGKDASDVGQDAQAILDLEADLVARVRRSGIEDRQVGVDRLARGVSTKGAVMRRGNEIRQDGRGVGAPPAPWP